MALGKGLGSILEEVEQAYSTEMNSFQDQNGEYIDAQEIDVEYIAPNPYQPRKHFDQNAIEELSASIRRHGLLQPIVVVKKDNEHYILVTGERRLRAHKLANLEKIKAIIADVDLDDLRLRELALVENIQRENLNAMELARSYQELIDEHKIRHEDLADIVHKSRSHITNTLRLLNLIPYVQEKLLNESISQGHAKVLVGIDEAKQKSITDTIMGQKLSVRQTENLVQTHKSNKKSRDIISKNNSILEDYRKELDKVLKFKHKVKKNSLEISFANTQEIEKFLSILQKV
ncbi:MAG: chromosome partitioning protein ParB [Sulfurovum sp. PC08-66]|nr:MAG: chromosome partitioning protein ParB [Sulfurovum sp. PC08-66]